MLTGSMARRVQVWQWLRDEEMGRLKGRLGAERWGRGHFPEAIRLFREFSTSKTLAPFLTLPAYERLHEPPMAKL